MAGIVTYYMHVCTCITNEMRLINSEAVKLENFVSC